MNTHISDPPTNTFQQCVYDDIKLATSLIESSNMLKEIKTFDEKSNKKSGEYRQMGNQHFSLKNQNYSLALQFYNKSICFAELNSENLSLGFGNRSAVYYELKEYDKCIENIKLARSSSSGLSANLQEKLNKREENCLSKLQELNMELNKSLDDYIKFIPKLSHPPHEKVPFIADCLELRENKAFGRFIITNRDLKVGECIAIESPLNCLTLESDLNYSRCAYCVQENCNSLIPCNYCTGTMFCSNDCFQKGFELFHKFECTSITALNMSPLIQRAALRLVLGLFSNIQELRKINKMEKDFNKINVFNFDYMNSTISTKYKLAHSLKTNENQESFENYKDNISVAAMFFIYLKDNIHLKEIFAKDSSYEKLFLQQLFYHVHTTTPYFLTLESFKIKNVEYLNVLPNFISGSFRKYDELNSASFAAGIYPLISMLNHSCSPNVGNFKNDNNQICLYVLRNIDKGEQIFDNYGPHHSAMVRKERHSVLKSQFLFDCKCIACKRNYPYYEDLKLMPLLPHLYSKKIFVKLMKNHKNFAKNVLSSCRSYLRKYDMFYPAAQVLHVQTVLQFCLVLLLGQAEMMN